MVPRYLPEMAYDGVSGVRSLGVLFGCSLRNLEFIFRENSVGTVGRSCDFATIGTMAKGLIRLH